jgi:hypothetical protein
MGITEGKSVTNKNYTISKLEVYKLLSALLLLGTVLVLLCLLYADNDLTIGVRLQTSADIFLYTTVSKPDLQPIQPTSKQIQTAVFNPIKRLKREPEHSSPSKSKIKNVWSYASNSPYIFVALCLRKHRLCKFL